MEIKGALTKSTHPLKTLGPQGGSAERMAHGEEDLSRSTLSAPSDAKALEGKEHMAHGERDGKLICTYGDPNASK